MKNAMETTDVLVIGGGPSGTTAAMRAAQKGLSVILLEKTRHPRFHIGESLLPRATGLMRELGLEERVSRLPHVLKYGATFVMGDDDKTTDFWFAPGPDGESPYAFNLERAPFDTMLMESAREAGADVRENVGVRSIDGLDESGVSVTTTNGQVRARILLDASGQGTVVGRHLGTRQRLPDLERVAYFQHFRGVHRREGKLGGSPVIVMCDEGWFWMIPLDAERTSIGVVMNHQIARSVGISPEYMLRWAIERCPYLATAMERAEGSDENIVTADFSYTCRPYAGPGYFLVGDAATFVDPIFSTGVCMGMMSAVQAADGAAAILRGERTAESVRSDYRKYVEGSSSVFFRLVRSYYKHTFHEMFLNGKGPLGVHNAVVGALAGHVFPRPAWGMRWRLGLFYLLMKGQDRVSLVPRRKAFSLRATEPRSLPAWGAGAVTPSGAGSLVGSMS